MHDYSQEIHIYSGNVSYSSSDVVILKTEGVKLIYLIF